MTFATLMLALIASSPAAEASRSKPIILDFTMAGCGPCRQMHPELDQLRKAGYPIRVVDQASDPDLCQRYNVTAFPTFIIVDEQGQSLAETSGYQPAQNLATLYRKARAKLAATSDEVPSVNEEDIPPADEASPADRDRNREDVVVEDAPRPRKLPKPWETVVRIKVHGPHSIGFGSGTIIASSPDESIILTCAHIFKLDGERQAAPKAFPRRIDVDLFDGVLSGPNHQMVHPVETVSGKAIDYDFGRDVGLISIRHGGRLPASPVVPKGYQTKEGQGLITAGCSEGNDATAWSTRVTKARTGGPSPSYLGTLCLSAPKQGRSGGGLYTKDGQVVGVCDFADYQGDRGFYASPESIHGILARNGLSDLAVPEVDPSRVLAARTRRPAPISGEGLRYRAQSDALAEAPVRPKAKAITIPAPGMLGIQTPQVAANDRAPSRSWGATATRSASSRRPQAEAAEFEMEPSVPQEEPTAAEEVDPVPSPKVVTRGGAWRASRRDDVARRPMADDDR